MLARGELRCIGTTTLDEYRKHLEKDRALERRFQPILVDQPSVEDTISILRGLRERYEVHHGVRIKDAALVSAAVLSDRYIADRFLPDRRSIWWTRRPPSSAPRSNRCRSRSMKRRAASCSSRSSAKRCARKPTRNHASAWPDWKRKSSRRAQGRTGRSTGAVGTRKRYYSATAQHARGDRKDENGDRSGAERVRSQRAAELKYGKLAQLERQLSEEESRLQAQGTQLVKEEVDEDDIAAVVSRWTGVPVSKLLEGEKEKLLRLAEHLHKRVIGQDEAVEAVADAVVRARSGLKDPNRPIGSFIFLAPTGVGKTELARALAEFLFDNDHNMVRIDMSEYQERHTVARLVGGPPGYVGYEEGGQLSEAVRRRPYSVVLFDEIEKAHTDVFNVLLQVLDDGRLTDGQGRTVDFKNTVIIMTFNVGSQLILGYRGGTESQAYEAMKREGLDALRRQFRPEFLNRIDEIVVFHSLSREQLKEIVEIQLERLRARLAERHIVLELSDGAREYLAAAGYDPQWRPAAEAGDSKRARNFARQAPPQRRGWRWADRDRGCG